jgi:hypothetical protein
MAKNRLEILEQIQLLQKRLDELAKAKEKDRCYEWE